MPLIRLKTGKFSRLNQRRIAVVKGSNWRTMTNAQLEAKIRKAVGSCPPKLAREILKHLADTNQIPREAYEARISQHRQEGYARPAVAKGKRFLADKELIHGALTTGKTMVWIRQHAVLKNVKPAVEQLLAEGKITEQDIARAKRKWI